MGRTVDELLSSISSEELVEWELYYEMEPWGVEQAWHRAGMITSMLYNIASKKGTTVKSSADFVPDYMAKFTQPVKQTVEQMKEAFGIIAKAFNKNKE